MNENLNLCEILKDTPVGTELWTPIFGKVKLTRIDIEHTQYPIKVSCGNNMGSASFTKEGFVNFNFEDVECVIFPSKDQRDWSLFKSPGKLKQKVTLQAFDRVLVRNTDEGTWEVSLLSGIIEHEDYPYITINGKLYAQCIPYDSNTYTLLGTDADCSIDYEITFDKSYAPRIQR